MHTHTHTLTLVHAYFHICTPTHALTPGDMSPLSASLQKGDLGMIRKNIWTSGYQVKIFFHSITNFQEVQCFAVPGTQCQQGVC